MRTLVKWEFLGAGGSQVKFGCDKAIKAVSATACPTKKPDRLKDCMLNVIFHEYIQMCASAANSL